MDGQQTDNYHLIIIYASAIYQVDNVFTGWAIINGASLHFCL